MVKSLIDNFKKFDDMNLKILKYGLLFCFFIGLIATAILITYIFAFTYPILFDVGLAIFRLSLIFAIEFIVCSFAMDGIKNGF